MSNEPTEPIEKTGENLPVDPPSDPPADPPKETPAPDPNLAKALSDIQKLKARNKELEDAREKERLDKLRESENWQGLAKEHETRASSLAEENKTLKESIVFDKKYSAVKNAALQAGLRKEAITDLELIDLYEVDIETTSTGRMNVLNVDKAVERIKASRPHWFGRGKSANLNADEPGVLQNGSDIKYSDLLKAEENAKKTGDYATYQNLLMKYKEQIRR